jgi:DNA mismatch repair protein MutL
MDMTSENKIELLPEHIIDQIKAGEVIERPASLIKELIENSIDAKSTQIDIHVIDNGLELISIEDNGKGMNFKNLPFAFLRHATSKLKTFEDIYRLHTYGFRGEALASIAASSRVTCLTQPENLNEEGGKIIINGGLEELLVPTKNNQSGTAFYIKNLFYNTPARMKFIKSKTSERIQLKKILNAFFISHPEISFSLRMDDKEKNQFKKTDTKLNRITEIFFGRNKEEHQVIHAVKEYEGHFVEVYLSTLAFGNSPNKQQYLFANDRLFFDKGTHQAVIRTMEQFWKFGDSGHYAIFINTPAEEIDVNVHPNKTQVKFAKSDIVYSLLVTAIKEAILNFKKSFNDNQMPLILGQINYPNEMPLSSNNHFNKENYLNKIQFENDLNHATQNPNHLQINLHAKSDFRLRPITNNYAIIEKQGMHFLINKSTLFCLYLDYYMSQTLSNDELITPLLISEPIKFFKSFDLFLPDLKKMGFECDRLSDEMCVLRTVPKDFNIQMSSFAVILLINYLKLNKLYDIHSLISFAQKNQFPMPDFSIYQSLPPFLNESHFTWFHLLTDDSFSGIN